MIWCPAALTGSGIFNLVSMKVAVDEIVGEGVTKSAVNQLEVTEVAYQARIDAINNLASMKVIENTWLKVRVFKYRGCVWCQYVKPKKRINKK